MPNGLINHHIQPIATKTIRQTQLDIYLAKDIHTPTWQHPKLRQLVNLARQSYKVHGNVPTEDEYDDKSLIYLVKASYRLENEPTNPKLVEWFSLRIIPAEGQPEGNQDVSIYGHLPSQTPFLKLFSQSMGLNSEQALKQLYTISRVCAIRPQLAVDATIKQMNNPITYTNAHTSISFAFALETFINSFKSHKLDPVLTCQMNQRLIDHLNIFEEVAFELEPADSFLKTDPGSIRIMRHQLDWYPYHYPGNFLNINELSQMLHNLIKEEKISLETLSCYINEDLDPIQILKQPHIKQFKNFGKLLTHKGTLPHARITGGHLRQLVSKHVSDGPKLLLVSSSKLEKNLKRFFEHAYKNYKY